MIPSLLVYTPGRCRRLLQGKMYWRVLVHEISLVLRKAIVFVCCSGYDLDFLSFRCLNPNPEERPDIVEVRCCAESLQCQTLHLRGSK